VGSFTEAATCIHRRPRCGDDHSTAEWSKFGAEAKIGSPQDFAAFIAAEVPTRAALVEAGGAGVPE
jgi:hypothetical protein